MHEEEDPRRYRLEDGFANCTAIPNEVIESRTLSGNAKALYAILIHVIVFKRDEPMQEGLGALLGGGVKTARSALTELHDAGLLEAFRPGLGQPNYYVVMRPEGTRARAQKCPEGTSRSAAPELPSVKPKTVKDKDKPLHPKAVRAPDPLWDTLAELFGGSPGGRSERGVWNTALQSLRESGATPDSLRAAAQAWPAKYEHATMTPTALAKHWTILTGHPKTAEDFVHERVRDYVAEREQRWAANEQGAR